MPPRVRRRPPHGPHNHAPAAASPRPAPLSAGPVDCRPSAVDRPWGAGGCCHRRIVPTASNRVPSSRAAPALRSGTDGPGRHPRAGRTSGNATSPSSHRGRTSSGERTVSSVVSGLLDYGAADGHRVLRTPGSGSRLLRQSSVHLAIQGSSTSATRGVASRRSRSATVPSAAPPRCDHASALCVLQSPAYFRHASPPAMVTRFTWNGVIERRFHGIGTYIRTQHRSRSA